MTPDKIDAACKDMTATVRQAFTAVRKRRAAVAADPTVNGVSALTAELQNSNSNGVAPMPPTQEDTDNDKDDIPTSPPAPKRRRIAQVTPPTAPTITPEEEGPPRIKCQGCIHGDLRSMKTMESTNVKHYLKQNECFELATCAGDCAKLIREIYLAAPKATLFYCDELVKGLYAPDDDLKKVDMECGLLLCGPCYAIRDVRYEAENAMEGTVNRRNSRRGTNR